MSQRIGEIVIVESFDSLSDLISQFSFYANDALRSSLSDNDNFTFVKSATSHLFRICSSINCELLTDRTSLANLMTYGYGQISVPLSGQTMSEKSLIPTSLMICLAPHHESSHVNSILIVYRHRNLLNELSSTRLFCSGVVLSLRILSFGVFSTEVSRGVSGTINNLNYANQCAQIMQKYSWYIE